LLEHALMVFVVRCLQVEKEVEKEMGGNHTRGCVGGWGGRERKRKEKCEEQV
jgi:hypothetical protein